VDIHTLCVCARIYIYMCVCVCVCLCICMFVCVFSCCVGDSIRTSVDVVYVCVRSLAGG